MIVRISDPVEDAIGILEAAKDFVSRMDFKGCFPEDPEKFVESISRVMTYNFVEVVAAEKDSKIVGLIGMTYLPHLWNQDAIHAEEIFWWTSKEAPITTGLRLLNFVKKRVKEKGASLMTFRKLTSSPEKVADVYKRMGLVEVETTYSGVV